MAKQIVVKPAVPIIGAGIGLLVGHWQKKPVSTKILYGLTGAGTAYAGAVVVMATPSLRTLIETKTPSKLP